ncbi:ABC transporter related [Halorhabdus utahensis DSM 12940]|uniref:Molybdate/tungstate import ATP-binding protein WtpC n=1 Tax=Halorhabdus utahensis (strain DSM 12940 / JCM 11049 / AX-2) TaxID=519442 RepID=C7NN13_HALUD|nr:ABC transporter ATP-binding protein [Halorhabdus utahensis]ACV11413.1 ABC transporter related [Halorhabdus utahensis DSM 12940]
MAAESALTVTGLRKAFGDEFELSGIDVTVGTDEIVALLGPSGCGKTTALRCIAGVETPDAGRIEAGGKLVQGEGVSLPPEQRDIGMVYQNYAIWPHKTVYGNVVFPLEHAEHDVPADRYEERVEEILDLVEIGDLKDSPATDLSGGQQQRVALARSLVHDPELLLLDEPLSNLDKGLRKHMRYELQRLQHEIDVSMLYVTHDQEEAFYLADRILVMRDGEVVERGEPRELYNRPTSPFTRRFVGDRNRFIGRITTNAEGESLVETDFATFPLASADFVAERLEDAPATCFVRPADISIGRFGGEHGGVLEFAGTVVAEGLLDERYEVTVDLGGTKLIVHTGNGREFERGESVPIYFEPGDVQVYAGDE